MEIVLLTSGDGRPDGGQPVALLPALGLLPHLIHTNVRDIGTLTSEHSSSVVLVDARQSPADARATCRTLHATRLGGPTLAVVSQSGLASLSDDWGIDDLILTSAGPAEIEARLRLAVRRPAGSNTGETDLVRAGALVIDPRTYVAWVKDRRLDLTHLEFALLRFLAQSPDRVFTRGELMHHVWGRDYGDTGGTRTIDVHVRRLRVKLGSDHESFISTVRGVGYKFVAQQPMPADDAGHEPSPGRVLRHGAAGDQASRPHRRPVASRRPRAAAHFR